MQPNYRPLGNSGLGGDDDSSEIVSIKVTASFLVLISSGGDIFKKGQLEQVPFL